MIKKLLGRLQNMAKAEILRMIPADIYEKIKKQDDHPEFRVYAIAHEGTAKGTIIERPEIMKQSWFKKAVQKLTNVISYGIKLFHLHKAGTNDHELRQPIGEVVGKATKEINGKTYSMVAVYIYPEFRDMPLDIASIEADMVFEKQRDSAIIKDILKVTGIALGNSAVVKPAFAGATLLGTVQAFARRKKGGSMSDKVSEIKELLKEEGLKPSDVFDEDELRNDPIVVDYVKKEKQGEYLHRKRTDEAFDRARAEWEKEKKDLEAKIKQLSVEKTKFQVSDYLQELAQERNLNEVQVKFINKNLKKFEINEPEKVKEELDKFIDEQLKDFEETQKLLLGDKADNKEKEKDGKGTPPVEGNEPESEEEYENPEKNEFINV